MARARDPNREIAKQLYLDSNGETLLKDIAKQLGKNEGTIRGWKNKDSWDNELNGTLQSNERNAPIEKQVNEVKMKANVVEELPLIENDDLTDKQRLFCIYYVKLFNATKAYQKAYECDYTTANASGSRMLVNVSIQKEIMRLKQHRMTGEFFDKYDVLQKYKDIAFADITDFTTFGTETVNTIDESGNEVEYEVNRMYFKDSTEIDGTIVAEVKQGKDGVSIKLADKMKALDFLVKYTDLLNDNELKQLKAEKERIAINKLSGETAETQESEIAKMLRKMAGDE